jgi:hypothetical protein
MTDPPIPTWQAATVAAFSNCHATAPSGHVPISEILQGIRHPTPEQADLIARVRAAATKDERDRLKENLTAVVFAADLHHRRGGTPMEDRLIAWSGVAAMDLDDLADPAATRESLRGDPFVAAAFLSPSGMGVKVLVRLAEPQRFADCWRSAATYFRVCHGITVDPAPKSMVSLCYLSADPDLYVADGEVEAFQPMAGEAAPEPIDGQSPDQSGPLRPGDDFNRHADLIPLLQHHGWSLVRDGPNQHWCRPGKTSGTSATLKDGVFYVFTSNAPPFEPNHAYSPFAVFALLEHGGDFAAAARALRQHGFGDPPLSETVTSPSEPEMPDPGPIPTELLRVPGFISEVMDYCLATAPYPNQAMAFCGALALQAFLAGRKVREPGGLRTNLYLLGLAHSASGKDWPRKINTTILHEIGLSDRVGDRFASGEGLQDSLFVNPAMLFQTDEIDGLLQSINKAQDARHEGIMSALLTLYTSADSVVPMRRKAGQAAPGVIDQPCLVIFGTAIPNHYFEALSRRMLTNGLFARMIVVEGGKRGAGQDASPVDPPATIIEAARWWADYQPSPGNLRQEHPIPATVPIEPAGMAVLADCRQLADQEYGQAEDRGDAVGTTVWGRVNEQARKLALIHAVSADRQQPRIDEAGATWACHFVIHQTQRMLAMAAGHVAENAFHAECQKLVEKLRAEPERTLDHSIALKRMKLRAKEFQEVIDTLVQQGDVEVIAIPRAGSAHRSYRLRSVNGAVNQGVNHGER